MGVPVERGPTLDGLGKYLREVVPESDAPVSDVTGILRRTATDVVVCYPPVGSERATEWYVERTLEAGCAFVNCIPVFIGSSGHWRRRFEERRLPIIGDDIKSQVGATIVHRALTNLFREREFAGSTGPTNSTSGAIAIFGICWTERVASKNFLRRTRSRVSSMPLAPENIHVGPSDYVPWLGDRKNCSIRMEATTFGNVPCCELKLEVWDSNSAGVVIDAVRCRWRSTDGGRSSTVRLPS